MITESYPEAVAVERWGDGETYGCCLVRNTALEPQIPAFYCCYVRFKVAPITDLRLWVHGPLSKVEAHGGITYAEVDADGSGVYGFDCAHAGDTSDPRLHDIAWLKAETERMRASILAVASPEESSS